MPEGEIGGLCWREWNDISEVCEGLTSFEGRKLVLRWRDAYAECAKYYDFAQFRWRVSGRWDVIRVSDMQAALRLMAEFCGPGWSIDHLLTESA